ncbi:MAG: hypothetical protein OXP69_05925 [Spirochaetaceae bacterium]|nr:hypothetical protein [Spirochaetaceae bacterium]
MTSYVLDTDTLSLLQRGNATVGARFGQYDADEVATTFIVDESPSARSRLAAPAPARGGAAAQRLTVARRGPSGSGNHSRVRLPPFALVRVAD